MFDRSGTSIAMKAFLPLLLLVAGCNREEKPEAPTPAESARLNEAEDMLNELARNEEGPASEDAGPSGNMN